jgi:hypothetical protein
MQAFTQPAFPRHEFLARPFQGAQFQLWLAESARFLGIPREVSAIHQKVLSNADNPAEYHKRFMYSIADGADLTLIFPQLYLWLLAQVAALIEAHALQPHVEFKKVHATVQRLFEQLLAGTPVRRDVWTRALNKVAVSEAGYYFYQYALMWGQTRDRALVVPLMAGASTLLGKSRLSGEDIYAKFLELLRQAPVYGAVYEPGCRAIKLRAR